MKRINIIPIFCTILFTVIFSSCQENFNERYLITENSIEFNDAVISTVATGKTYPIVTRTLTSTNAEITFEVNLIGKQFTADQAFEVRVVDSETLAVENRDYKFTDGKRFVIPKGKSKGVVKVQNTATGVGSNLVVLELVGVDGLKVSKNYSRVGFRCVYP